MTPQRYTEYLRDCAAPNEADLDARQEELLRQIEFVVMMRRMWNGAQEA
jgi:hypothetical protein